MQASERPGTGRVLIINISARPPINLSLFGFKSSRLGVGGGRGGACSANNNDSYYYHYYYYCYCYYYDNV